MPNSIRRFQKLLLRIRHKFRYGLFLDYIFGRLAKIGLKIFPYYLFQESLLLFQGESAAEDSVELAHKLDDYVPSFLEPSDMKAIASLSKNYKYSGKELLVRLANGSQCFGVKYNGDVVAFVWCNFHECLHPPLRFALKEDEAYLYDAFTIETHRGKNLSPYIRYQLYKHAEKMGRIKYYSVSPLFNTSAIKAQLRMKAKPLKLYLHVSLFKKYEWNFLLRNCEKGNFKR